MTPPPSSVRYSCLMADAPRFAQQTLTWAWTLLDLAHVPAARLRVHALPDSDAAVRRQIEALGIETRTCKPFRAGHPHCNKLRQLEDPDLAREDVVVLCDTDLAFAGPIDAMLSTSAVRAKIVDLPNPPLDIWRAIFEAAALPPTVPLAETSFGGAITPAVNCNGGLYLLPGWTLEPLREAWTRWIDWLIDRPALLPGSLRVHLDQVAFGLAVIDRQLPLESLALDCNLPTHRWIGSPPDVDPRVIHYHDQVDASGFLTPTSQPRIDAAIARINDALRARRRQAFDNASFWDFRYSLAPDLGSGLGSRGAHLAYKRALLARSVRATDTVLDVGCGDLEVSRSIELAAFTGVDVSAEALAIARAKRPDWSFHRGALHDLPLGEHDVVVCFDVLIHQRQEAAYRALVARLLQFAGRTAIVSGYNQPPWHQSEITFFHEPITASLARLAGAAHVEIIGGYRDTTVVRVDVAAARRDDTTLAALQPSTVFDTPAGRFVSRPGDRISTHFEAYGGHTRNEIAMVRSLVAEGDAIVDVGAHIGAFTVPLARQAGATGVVVAIEPDAVNLERLYQNVVANDVADRVIVVEAVIAGAGQRVRAVPDAANTGALHFVSDAEAGPVRAVTLDAAIARALGSRRPNLLKIDVEGLELTVLRSAAATIDAARPIIYCEVVAAQLARQHHTVADLEAFLLQRDYALFRNAGDRNSTHDRFTIAPLASLGDGGAFFDCLAVPAEAVDGLIARDALPARDGAGRR
jgi:FkbM family methyltransferase